MFAIIRAIGYMHHLIWIFLAYLTLGFYGHLLKLLHLAEILSKQKDKFTKILAL